jgi:hypothetical protein
LWMLRRKTLSGDPESACLISAAEIGQLEPSELTNATAVSKLN